MRKSGFTLMELMVSMAVLTVVSLLSFIAVMTSTESAELSRAKAEVQGNLRDVMTELTTRVREAYTARTVESSELLAPEGTESISVSEDGLSLTFQVPVPTNGPDMVAASAPITVLFENEDTYVSEVGFNAKLDPGEDGNSDGALTRRVLFLQGATQEILGGANNISAVQFQLIPNMDTADDNLTRLRILLESTQNYGTDKMVRAQLESTVDLKN